MRTGHDNSCRWVNWVTAAARDVLAVGPAPGSTCVRRSCLRGQNQCFRQLSPLAIKIMRSDCRQRQQNAYRTFEWIAVGISIAIAPSAELKARRLICVCGRPVEDKFPRLQPESFPGD